MPALSSFDYAVIRVVPRVECEEFINAGVVLLCLERNFLAARIQVSDARLKALWPALDLELVHLHLDSFPRICSGDARGGALSRLSLRERFHWLVSPRSTIIQVSPVHTGVCDGPEAAFESILNRCCQGG